MRSPLRMLGILRVLLRYRLHELAAGSRLERVLRLATWVVPAARGDVARLSRGARLRLALQSLGPIFVKFGQVLATRRDLLPADVADELALLQDQVAPFAGARARAQVESALGRPVTELYAEFDETPLASASIAQVHAARLHDGREVVVKVLRPGIAGTIEADIGLLRALAALSERFGPDPERTRPAEVVDEIARSLRDELDLQREGANGSVLRRHFKDSADLYVPEVHWPLTCEQVLTLERVRGVRADDLAAIEAAGIDRRALAAKVVQLFYTQVFRDNFFHADAHPGNLWVDISRVERPRFIALDFGIMGALPEIDQFYLAENFMAIFSRDYRRIAQLHIDAGWMPGTLRIDDLEGAVRTVCEPYFTRPLSEIALGEVLLKLFKVAHQYQLTLQPQLILLQKTLLNIEGLGRLLDPKLDIWAVAEPVLSQILREKRSPQAIAKRLGARLPGLVAAAPEVAELMHAYLKQAAAGEHGVRLHSDDLRQLAAAARLGQRRLLHAVSGIGVAVLAAVLVGQGLGGPLWQGLPLAAWLGGGLALGLLGSAWLRRG
ncbi:MAG: ubiquinone biosynthesis regulatory protein kinase UbiB [Aquimonas sp.]|nr:ubiquinone biosynthesis regulatory protein kinase UbiB [Aquimonas sp.]